MRGESPFYLTLRRSKIFKFFHFNADKSLQRMADMSEKVAVATFIIAAFQACYGFRCFMRCVLSIIIGVNEQEDKMTTTFMIFAICFVAVMVVFPIFCLIVANKK